MGKSRLITALFALGSSLAFAALPLQAAETVQDAGQEWRFRVLLNDKDIGFHEFRVARDEGFEEVRINAEFDVRILFFNAYSYRHSNVEQWQGDCLARIESETDDNGDAYSVRGAAEGESFRYRSADGDTRDAPACTRSFAYWNPAFLESKRLLNAQTGELVEVEIRRGPDEPLQLAGQTVAASRYDVVMPDGTISLWYTRDGGQWLALQAPTPGGRMLRYEPVELPFELTPSQELAQN